MRWFKHLSKARRDEKIAALMADCGIEGYGFYFLLCEVVAETLEKDGVPSLTYTLPQWSHALYSHHHRVSKYLGKLRVTGLCEVSEVEGKIRVTIPNLLKYRDEYAGKSRHSPNELPTDSRLSRARVPETETETETEKETPFPPDGGGKSPDAKTTPDQQPMVRPPAPAKSEAATAAEAACEDTAKAIHARHPKRRRDISANAVAKLLRQIMRHKGVTVRAAPEALAEINRIHDATCASEDWQKDGGEFARSLENWLCPSKGRYEVAPVVPIRGPAAYIPPPDLMTPERIEAEREARRKRAEADDAQTA